MSRNVRNAHNGHFVTELRERPSKSMFAPGPPPRSRRCLSRVVSRRSWLAPLARCRKNNNRCNGFVSATEAPINLKATRLFLSSAEYHVSMEAVDGTSRLPLTYEVHGSLLLLRSNRRNAACRTVHGATSRKQPVKQEIHKALSAPQTSSDIFHTHDLCQPWLWYGVHRQSHLSSTPFGGSRGCRWCLQWLQEYNYPLL